MSEGEVDDLITYIASNPEAGDEIVGTGGFRKLRLAGKGKGKSGGYRIVTFFTGVSIPVFLMTVFAKGDRANLTQKERNQLKGIGASIVASYRRKVVKVSGER